MILARMDGHRLRCSASHGEHRECAAFTAHRVWPRQCGCCENGICTSSTARKMVRAAMAAQRAAAQTTLTMEAR